MKITAILLLICLAILFVPRYNLYEKDGTWSDTYLLRAKGFWLEKDCQQAGMQLDDPYRCVATNTWNQIWGSEKIR